MLDDGNRSPLVRLWKDAPKAVWLPVGVVSSLLTTLLLLVQPALLNSLVNSVSGNQSINSAAAGFVLVAVAAMITGALATLGDKKYSAILEKRFREAVVEAMSRVNLEDPLKRMSATQVLSHDVTVVAGALSDLSIRAVPKILLAVGSIAMMLMLDGIMVVVIVAIIATLLLAAVPTLKRMGQDEQTLSEHKDDLSARAEQMCALRETARGNRTLDVLGDRILEVNSEIFQRQNRLAVLSFRVDPVNSAMMNVTALVVLGIGAARVASGALDVGELLSFLMYLFMLAGPLMALASSLQNLQGQRAAAKRLIAVTEQASQPTMPRVTMPRATSGSNPCLELANVTFASRGRLIVPGLSDIVEPGLVTGLRGESGAGKTTLLRMLSGILEPTSGVIVGKEDADPERAVSYVAQRPAIIPQSLDATLDLYGGNQVPEQRLLDQLLRFGLIDSEHDMDRFREAALAGRLSGGEIQRFAIASALLSERPVLLLDEPTSALDKRHAAAIVEALQEYAGQGRIVVAASHDPNILAAVDHEIALGSRLSTALLTE